jgi:hypothetical protein
MTLYPKSEKEVWVKLVTGERFQLFFKSESPMGTWGAYGVRIKLRKRSWASQESTVSVNDPVPDQQSDLRSEGGMVPIMSPPKKHKAVEVPAIAPGIPSLVPDVPPTLSSVMLVEDKEEWWIDMTTISDERLSNLIQPPKALALHLHYWKQPLIAMVSRML